MNSEVKEAIIKATKGIWNAIPVLAGVILLVGLIMTLIPKEIYSTIFTQNPVLDPLIGGSIGSVLAGNPMTSYILGGELMNQGVSLLAIIAFIVAWVTVGIVQFPAEAYLLGKKFAIIRNAVSFVFAIIVAVVTVVILGIL